MEPREYMKRHNDVAKIIHQNWRWIEDFLLIVNHTADTSPKQYSKIPNMSYTGIGALPLIVSPRTIFQTFRNWKEVHKLEKYLNLANEIEAFWGLNRVKVISIVVSALRNVPTDLQKNLQILNLSVNIYSNSRTPRYSTHAT